VIIEEVFGKGHQNIRATHKSTFEITREDYVTLKGDCIILTSANKAVSDLSDDFKRLAKSPRTVIEIEVHVNGLKEVVIARGDQKLSFEDKKSMVVRKSGYVCGRTLAVYANKAAADFSREVVEKLRQGLPARVVIKAYRLCD